MSDQSTWLITGGAGYIGAHVADKFLESGLRVVIYDSLHNGLATRVDYLSRKYGSKVQFILADIRDTQRFTECIGEFKPVGIVHSAALKSVEESLERPSDYFEVNFDATREILKIIASSKVKNFVFSSTAAVYGSPVHNKPIREDEPKNPISPYGESKLLAEKEVEKFSIEHGINGVSLRFFNVVGTAAPELMDNSTNNLVPIVLGKLRQGISPEVFGIDYPTPDGSCIRDYVDVRDIANAHFKVSQSQSLFPCAFNIGTGRGVSVIEMIQMISSLFPDEKQSVIFKERRPGDPAILFADVSQIEVSTGFVAKFELLESLRAVVNN